MNSSPVFIVGAPRSGTTLAAKILGKHSRLFMPGETHYFDDIFSNQAKSSVPEDDESRQSIATRLFTLYERYYELEDQKRINKLFGNPQKLAEAIKDCGNHYQILEQFMKIQQESEGKCRWGNNAPRDIFNVSEIRACFPNCKIIICVRDVRAFLLSYKGKWKVTGESHSARLKRLYHPVVTSLLWKASMIKLKQIQEEVPSDSVLIVKYEDLVGNPERTVNKICACIEEKFEPSMLDVESQNSSYGSGGTGIFSTSVDRWVKGLDPQEIWIAQLLCRSEMELLGYKMEKVNINYFRVALTFIMTPYALLRALHANKESRGPLIPYLIRRLATFFR